jgi:hypothetical protein
MAGTDDLGLNEFEQQLVRLEVLAPSTQGWLIKDPRFDNLRHVYLGVGRQNDRLADDDPYNRSKTDVAGHQSSFRAGASAQGVTASVDYTSSNTADQRHNASSSNTDATYSSRSFGGNAWDSQPNIGEDQVNSNQWEVLPNLSENPHNLLRFAVESVARASPQSYVELIDQGKRLLAVLERRERCLEIEQIKNETRMQVKVHYQVSIKPRRRPYQKYEWKTTLRPRCVGSTLDIFYKYISSCQRRMTHDTSRSYRLHRQRKDFASGLLSEEFRRVC